MCGGDERTAHALYGACIRCPTARERTIRLGRTVDRSHPTRRDVCGFGPVDAQRNRTTRLIEPKRGGADAIDTSGRGRCRRSPGRSSRGGRSAGMSDRDGGGNDLASGKDNSRLGPKLARQRGDSRWNDANGARQRLANHAATRIVPVGRPRSVDDRDVGFGLRFDRPMTAIVRATRVNLSDRGRRTVTSAIATRDVQPRRGVPEGNDAAQQG